MLGAGGGHRFDVKVQKWNMIFFGVLFLVQGFTYLFRIDQGIWTKAMMGITFMSGFYVLIFGFINFSRTSKLAPKIKIDDTSIELKTGLFRKSTVLKWVDIQSIKFKPYQVNFKTADTVQIINYDTTSDISIDVKETIREYADKMNIEIMGG
jgi:hypothetical protein